MSIPAHHWVADSHVDPAVSDRWPSYAVVLVAADDVDVARLAPVADELFALAHDHARRLAVSEPHERIARWHQTYRDFGVRPRVARVSVDALVRRAVSEGGLPRINALVDMYNAISILHLVPIGGEDLDRYDAPARLAIATGDEPFHTTEHGQPVLDHPDPGEPVWLDRGDVTCRRWNWRQSTRTAIHADTRRVGFIVDSLDAPDHLAALGAAEHLAGLMPSASTRLVATDRPQ